MNHFLQCEDVAKSYKDFALQPIRFTLPSGYLLGVVGKNGAGKSTLSKCLLGATHFEGNVTLDGICLKDNPVAYKNCVGYVLHEGAFPLFLSSADIGAYYGRHYAHFDWEQYRERLNAFDISIDEKLKNLSEGQKIRQQLAFALSYGAKLLVMDEPNANLDIAFRDRFYELIQQLLQAENCSVIYVSHLVDEIERYADYLLWLREGEMQYYGTTEEFFDTFCAGRKVRPTLKELLHEKEQEMREQEIKEQEIKEQEMRNQEVKDQEIKDQKIKEHEIKEG